MPRKRLPPRLYLEPERKNDAGTVTHGGWVIRDGSTKIGTGCRAVDHRGAAKALETYLSAKHSSKSLPKHRAASEIIVDDVIRHYVDARGKRVKNPTELARRLETLLGFWGGRTMDEIDTRTCALYLEHRGDKLGSARRELDDLRAAVTLAIKDKLTLDTVTVTLPPPAKPRSHYLTRDAAARLVWAAYNKREKAVVTRGPRKGQSVATSRRPTKHIARFILFGLYTGSRSRRVWTASYNKIPGHPFIDVENGVFYREAPEEVASKTKQAPPIRIPDRLLAHLRRWKSAGAQFLCEYHKGKPGDPKKGFRRLVDEVLEDEADEIVRHSLRHTAASWLMQANEDAHAVAGYLGMRTDTLISVYAHHDPEYHRAIGDSFSKGRAGRNKQQREAMDKARSGKIRILAEDDRDD